LNKIKQVTGIDFQFQVDMAQLYNNPDISNNTKACLGSCVYGSQLTNLATLFEEFIKGDDMSKQALIDALGDKKVIRYVVDKNLDICDKYVMGSFSGLTIKDGELWMVTKPEYVGFGNSYDVESFGDLFVGLSDSDIPLNIRRNIRDAESDLDKNMARIKKATGVDFTFKCDMLSIYKQVKNVLTKYDLQRIGTKIYDSQLGNLATTLEEFCKDEMCKEALQDACDKKIIRYMIGDVTALCPNCSYYDMAGYSFKDGELIMVTKSERVGFGNVLDASLLEKDL